jgi:DNA-binding Lrp family transcriptional regulator
MDHLDSKLISLLRTNARMTVSALAHNLKVSRGTITNRLQRLEKTGVIGGYTLRLSSDNHTNEIRAWMCIVVNGDKTQSVIADLLGEPCVVALHDTNGRWDLLAELQAPTLQQLSAVLERIRASHDIQTSETSIHLATFRG